MLFFLCFACALLPLTAYIIYLVNRDDLDLLLAIPLYLFFFFFFSLNLLYLDGCLEALLLIL
jgi:hypothetical protein